MTDDGTELCQSAAAYALDALEPGEAREFARHLRGCRTCTAEVEACRSTVARWTAPVSPPPLLRERVLTAVRDAPQVAAPLPLRASLPRQVRVNRVAPWWLPWGVAAAVCLLVVFLATVYTTAVTGRDAQAAQDGTRADRIEAIVTAPDARATTVRGARGAAATVVASARQQAAIISTDLPAAAHGTRYVLWCRDATGATKRIGPVASGPQTTYVAGPDMARASAIAVTSERDDDATQAAGPVVLTIALPPSPDMALSAPPTPAPTGDPPAAAATPPAAPTEPPKRTSGAPGATRPLSSLSSTVARLPKTLLSTTSQPAPPPSASISSSVPPPSPSPSTTCVQVLLIKLC